jgi:hypothetical protein
MKRSEVTKSKSGRRCFEVRCGNHRGIFNYRVGGLRVGTAQYRKGVNIVRIEQLISKCRLLDECPNEAFFTEIRYKTCLPKHQPQKEESNVSSLQHEKYQKIF